MAAFAGISELLSVVVGWSVTFRIFALTGAVGETGIALVDAFAKTQEAMTASLQ